MTPRRWSQEEDDRLRRWYSKYGNERYVPVPNIPGRTTSAVENRVRYLGLRTLPPVDYLRRERMRAMKEEGKTYREIAEAYGISIPRAFNLIHKKPRKLTEEEQVILSALVEAGSLTLKHIKENHRLTTSRLDRVLRTFERRGYIEIVTTIRVVEGMVPDTVSAPIRNSA